MYKNMLMAEDKTPPRGIEYSPPNDDKYSRKTLQGNWFEDRSKYKHPTYKYDRSYNYDYTEKELPKDNKVDRKHAFIHQGVNPIVHPKTGCYDYPNYYKNFTTTTDLSYNHFPKFCEDTVFLPRKFNVIQQKYVPMEEYLEPFHNLTNFGLSEYKKQIWANKSKKLHTTVYKETYLPPHKDCYEFPRWGRARDLSSFIFSHNKIIIDLRLRGFNSPGFFVPTPSHPRLLNKRKTCNVITWECPPEQKVCVPKHEWKNCLHQDDILS